MKKSSKKEQKGQKETEEEKKQRKEREKQEKKEKKEKKKEAKKEKKDSKKDKKSHHSESSSSLDSKGSRSHEQLNESTSVTKTTKITATGSPGRETKTTVLQETRRDEHGQSSTTTKTIEETPTKESASGETVVKKTTTTITKSEPEPDKAVDRSLTTKTEIKIQETPIKESASGETVVKKTTTTITKSEPTPDKAVDRSSTTKTEIKVQATPTKEGVSGETVVKETTTTITKSEPAPDKAVERSLTTKTETTKIEENGPTKVPTPDDNLVKKTTTSVTKSEPDPGKVVESKTIVKETSRSSPAGEEKVVVTRTTSEVESGIPTTREFLERNFPNMPEDAKFEITRHFQNGVVSEDLVPPVDKPSHFSQRTVIQEVGDGGRTEKTVTKTITDEDGTRKTTITTSEGNGDNITSTDSNRKVDFPDWLEKKDTTTPRGRATIDHTIKIPSPAIERKERPKHEPTGPKVTEEIQPSEQKKKDDIADFLDDLAKPSQEEPEEKQKPTQPNQTENKITEAMDSFVESAPPKTENANEFEEKTLPKQAQREDENVHKEKEVRKFIRDDGNTIETVTETKHEDGKVERTTTTTTKQRKDKSLENIDINANIVELEKPKSVPLRKEKNKQGDDDIFVGDDEVIDPEEVFEEILVVEQKRKVRFPKSFLPRKPERPRSWALPLDVLIDRPRTRRTPRIYSLEVKEQVDQKAMDRSVSMQDLDDLLTAIDAAE